MNRLYPKILLLVGGVFTTALMAAVVCLSVSYYWRLRRTGLIDAAWTYGLVLDTLLILLVVLCGGLLVLGLLTFYGLRRLAIRPLQTIQEETRRLTDLLNNYLGLLKSAPEPAPVDLRDLCRRVLRLLAAAALKARVELRLEGDEELPPVVGVPDRLQQAVLNLALNAIQAMPNGGVVALRKFFTGGTQTDSGEEMSWDAIKAALSEIVAAEDKKNPLSDEQLVDED